MQTLRTPHLTQNQKNFHSANAGKGQAAKSSRPKRNPGTPRRNYETRTQSPSGDKKHPDMDSPTPPMLR
ncbi:MAG: hypothetical protein II375_02205 [Bacteroidales bacterium]|nr:hypothetical protein [Bacteroidales bacterium]